MNLILICSKVINYLLIPKKVIGLGIQNKLENGTILVTGGAGIIGSHIVDRLVSNKLNVKVLDNLSNGNIKNLKNINLIKNPLIKKDLNDLSSIHEVLSGIKLVFHMAADPEVSIGFKNPEIHFKENIKNTFNLLEAIRKSDVENILFASSSTIYGEPDVIPTPENYAPLLPISTYGASKLACEALITSYCYTYGIDGIIFRLANIVGARSNHGIIPDFIKKLQNNSNKLDILGDGSQSKSYLDVSDCVDSLLFCLKHVNKRVEVFNIGNNDKINVMDIAKIVCKNMNLNDVILSPDGGVDNGGGWIGDVKTMQLDITKLENLGWTPKLSSGDAIEKASKDLQKYVIVK